MIFIKKLLKNMELIIDSLRMSDPDDELYSPDDLWLEDFIENKDGEFEITGTLGVWTGTHEIKPVILDNNLKAIFKCLQSADDFEIYKDDNDYIINAHHHDGTNKFRVHELS